MTPNADYVCPGTPEQPLTYRVKSENEKPSDQHFQVEPPLTINRLSAVAKMPFDKMDAVRITRATLDSFAEAYGATVTDDGYDLIVDAPDGKIWACDRIAYLVAPYRNHMGQTWVVKACADLAERMAYGLVSPTARSGTP